MYKPILLVGFPVKHMEVRHLPEIDKVLSKRMPDYHVLPYISRNEDDISFRVLYDKDTEPIDFDGLKKIVLGINEGDKSE